MSDSILQSASKGRYVSIFSDGTIREKVDRNHPDAQERIYENKEGAKVTKYEAHYPSLVGKIVGVEFRDGEYGQQIYTTFRGPDGDELTLAANTSSNFGSSLMKILPNVDLSKELWLRPYAFQDDSGKDRRGVTIKQDDDKLTNFFYDGEKNVNGFPEPEGDKGTYDKDDWKMYFMGVKKFLVGYTETNICPKFENKLTADIRDGDNYPTPESEGITAEDMPF